ncbi:MAG: N-acetylmuramoyl-L-alanine amidase [Magnetococcales bacterium]|nr:N-acetylmuramoyl-L-alanine amidase [Magnetococcales bacterium]
MTQKYNNPDRVYQIAQAARRQAVIVVDPGHGGEDPGAIGAGGTHEKNITLDVAYKLVYALGAAGYNAILTRTDDYFVPIRERISIASRHRADMFISLHADAFQIPSARGASVYCLPGQRKPNFNVHSRAMAYSGCLLTSIKKVPSLRLHCHSVKYARFAVLRSPAIPSVLVEMAFLSNRDEEIQLRKKEYQNALVLAMLNGTKSFFRTTSLT